MVGLYGEAGGEEAGGGGEEGDVGEEEGVDGAGGLGGGPVLLDVEEGVGWGVCWVGHCLLGASGLSALSWYV